MGVACRGHGGKSVCSRHTGHIERTDRTVLHDIGPEPLERGGAPSDMPELRSSCEGKTGSARETAVTTVLQVLDSGCGALHGRDLTRHKGTPRVRGRA